MCCKWVVDPFAQLDFFAPLNTMIVTSDCRRKLSIVKLMFHFFSVCLTVRDPNNEVQITEFFRKVREFLYTLACKSVANNEFFLKVSEFFTSLFRSLL